MSRLSEYASGLSAESKERYLEKISYLNNIDPYTLNHADFDEDYSSLPKIDKKSIIDYLIFKASWETQLEMRAYKSTDAFMQNVCKWVQKVYFKKYGEVFLLFGLVMHSQRINQPSLKPWLIISQSGEVLCGHCDCVAGLGEVCTHVAAILFALEKFHDNAESVTDIFAYWKKPASKPNIHSTIREITWTLPHATMQEKTAKDADVKLSEVPEMSREDVVEFLQQYKEAGQSSVLHNVLKEFTSDKTNSPQKIIELHSPNYVGLTLEELQEISADIPIIISESESTFIEEKTRQQAKSNEWFQYRAGRITASKFKAVCRTKLEKPSLSFIRSVCYPQLYKRVVKQMEYGCKHEKDALQSYLEEHKRIHGDVHLEKVGLIINPHFPEFGASPDSYVLCPECGEGCVEVKCPFCVKSSPISELAEKKHGRLKKSERGLHLDRQHAYFYQVQMQLFVTQKKICDFVVWNENQLFVETVLPDKEFWSTEKNKATQFFRKCILPEILGKYFTTKSDDKVKVQDLTDHQHFNLEEWNQPNYTSKKKKDSSNEFQQRRDLSRHTK